MRNPESLFRILSAALPKVKIGDVNYVLIGYKSKENVYGLEEPTLIFEAQPLVDDFVIRVDLVGHIIEAKYTTWIDKLDMNYIFFERNKTTPMIDIEIQYKNLVFPWNGECCCELYQSPEFRNKADRLVQKVTELKKGDEVVKVSMESIDISISYCDVSFNLRGIVRGTKNVTFWDEFTDNYLWDFHYHNDFNEVYEYLEEKALGYLSLHDLILRE